MALKYKYNSGFTLVELAIVLVIIGLIVVGVLTGQTLIETSKINKAIKELNGIKTSDATFYLKYNAMAGDMPNATSYWPTATNGNGDGSLTEVLISAGYSEEFQYWVHMQNAEMLELSDTTLTGANGGGSYRDADLGINSPVSRVFPQAGYGLSNYAPATLAPFPTYHFSTQSGNILYFGTEENAAFGNEYELVGPFLTAPQASQIDTKMDDGKPGKGIILSYPNSSAFNTACSTTDSINTAEYNVIDNVVRCSLIMKLKK